MEPGSIPRVSLGSDGYSISRLLVGLWQLSEGHRASRRTEEEIFSDFLTLARAGLTTFDVADIYTGVEECLGRFIARHAADLRREALDLQVHTKLVPDRDALASISLQSVADVVHRSLRRLRVERLDLVQFSWWDLQVAGYVDAALHLQTLQQQGKIRHLGVTNFNTESTAEILAAGVPLVAHQTQYSVLDRRPRTRLADCAEVHGMGLLCYGALAGGFLTDRYHDSAAPGEPLANRSLIKYRLIIEEAGGWEAYQRVLATLRSVARRHRTTTASVALRWVLEQPGVRAVILGTFHAGHLPSHVEAVKLSLSEEDLATIESALDSLRALPGDPFDLERDPAGPHFKIMWKNLNRNE